MTIDNLWCTSSPGAFFLVILAIALVTCTATFAIGYSLGSYRAAAKPEVDGGQSVV